MLNRNHFARLRVFHGLAIVVVMSFGLAGAAAASPNTAENHDICAHAIDRAESGAALPRDLMTAISRVESGRWDSDRKALSAWPWTVTNGADGQYFPTKAEAVAHVRKLRARGVRNIDVGCMQINLHYHPDAFDNLDTALDPHANARYAASLLDRLFTQNRSWGEAIKRYHSSKAKFNRPYHEKVMRQWNIAKRESAESGSRPVRTALSTNSTGAPKKAETPVRTKDDPRRLAAEAYRKAVIARHRAERARHRSRQDNQMASAGTPSPQ